VKGHVLVVPKTETDKLFDLTDDYLKEILVFSKPIAHAIEKTFPCNRCGISVMGLEVPHAHVHLIPINSADDLNFNRAKLKLSAEELKEVQEKIIAALS
jgi:histidine triad (HIT) family protein